MPTTIHTRLLVALCSLILLSTGTSYARTHISGSKPPAPGHWTRVGISQSQTLPTLLALKDGSALLLFSRHTGQKFSYLQAAVAHNGAVTQAAHDIFAGKDWDSLAFDPVLVNDAGNPAVVFSGGRDGIHGDPYALGCLVGSVLESGSWKLQSWSLSAGCHNIAQLSAAGAGSSVDAAWSLNSGLAYHVGTDPNIPAKTADHQRQNSTGVSEFAGLAVDSKNAHLYGGWYQVFSKPASKDGVYVADLNTTASTLKAPESGTNDGSRITQRLALAAPAGRGGVYAAYCNNTVPCTKLLLWKYGAKSTLRVPNSGGESAVAMTAGPSGRLWLAWFEKDTGKVRTARTNMAGTVFGPVETYSGPAGCAGDGVASIALAASGNRLDLAVNCTDFNAKNFPVYDNLTQSLTGLSFDQSASSINHKTGGSLTIVVKDAGDPVRGAKVVVDGKTGTTNSSGRVAFKFAKGSKTGTFTISASKTDYFSHNGVFKVT